MTKQYIVSLKEVGNGKVDQIGGKAANLAILLRAGFAVPDGFAVPLEAFKDDGKLHTEAKEQIETSVDGTKKYAVRSSATVEDAVDQSWAGQFESYLFVDSKDIATKVEECHGAVKARARAYASKSKGETKFDVAVVVQEMIDPVYAGVMFTENPVSGKHELVIEYVAGVGEQLVSGQVTPEDFTWDRKKRVVKSDKKVPFNTDELAKVGIDIEALFDDAPQDIEWAIDSSNKLWITQSRPITTLSIEHVGKGYHYLGDPSSLFYWGPAKGRALYMSDFLAAVRTRFMEWHDSTEYPSPPKTLILLKEDKFLWLNKKSAFESFVVDLFEAYLKHGDLDKDKQDFVTAVNKIDSSKTYQPEELFGLLDPVWQSTFAAEFALYGAEASIAKHLTKFTEMQRHIIWGTFSLPELPSFINVIDKEVMKLKNPAKLADKFPWALNSYAGVATNESLIKYFTKRIKDLEGNDDIVVGEHADRQALAEEFKLSEDLQHQLNLAREIAEFMDERKAWMMQSRVVVQKMVKAQAVKNKQDLLDLERCRLEDLTQDTPKEYFGWTYIDGLNIDLGEQDVARSWDWYVQYKAASSVLKGIVSSRGGKHFMTGEVVVVHDPAEQVADGKVVVVPSTGPSYVPIMRKAAALITDHGGMMSHAAIVAREFNLPCIVGTVHATKLLKTGDNVLLDLVKGEISK